MSGCYLQLVIVYDGGSLYWEEGENRSFEVPFFPLP